MLTDVSDRTAHVLWLLRMLIEYGRQLAETVQNRCANTDLTEITCGFGAIDIALILSRITRGSQLAAALKDPNARASVICLRTAAEIAAQVRRRAVGAVVADICRYLGIVPADPLWPDITFAVLENGGSIIDLVMNTLRRMTQGVIEASPDVDFGPLPFAARYRVVSGAGPP